MQTLHPARKISTRRQVQIFDSRPLSQQTRQSLEVYGRAAQIELSNLFDFVVGGHFQQTEIYRFLPGRVTQIDFLQLGPLRHHQFDGVAGVSRGRASGQNQPFHGPRGHTNQARIAHFGASSDVQNPQLFRFLQHAFDLRVIEAVEVTPTVDGYVKFPQIGEAQSLDLFLNGSVAQGDHGVVGVQHSQLLTSLLELFYVNGNNIARRRRYVGNIQFLQIFSMFLKGRRKRSVNKTTFSRFGSRLPTYR